MSHPLVTAAAEQLAAAEGRRTAAREVALRTWGPRSVTAASRHARRLLGPAAVALQWGITGLLSFEENHLQAVAALGTVSGRRLELHYSGLRGTEDISLRVSCESCAGQSIHEVMSLEQLGLLLSEAFATSSDAPKDGGPA